MKLNKEQSDSLKHFGQDYKREYKEQLHLAKKSGYNIKKMWSTSVWYENTKPMICEKHPPYEKLGFVDLNYEYKPNLKFPFDPDCQDPEEFNNCRCWMGYKVYEL